MGNAKGSCRESQGSRRNMSWQDVERTSSPVQHFCQEMHSTILLHLNRAMQHALSKLKAL